MPRAIQVIVYRAMHTSFGLECDYDIMREKDRLEITVYKLKWIILYPDDRESKEGKAAIGTAGYYLLQLRVLNYLQLISNKGKHLPISQIEIISQLQEIQKIMINSSRSSAILFYKPLSNYFNQLALLFPELDLDTPNEIPPIGE